jgi:hypothetical protein
MVRGTCRSPRPRRGGATGPDTEPPDVAAPGEARRRPAGEDGFLSLEWVLTVPVMLLLAALVVAAGYLVRDVLVLQEAARVGARTASTTAGQQAVHAAVHDAAPELGGGLSVAVAPMARRPGDHVEVVVTTTRSYGPLSHRLVARSTARVEPVLDGGGPTGPAGPLVPIDPTAPRGSAPSGRAP